MKTYCTCGIRRIEQTFVSGGVVFCIACKHPVCCRAALGDPAIRPHAAEVAVGQRFECWAHRNRASGSSGRRPPSGRTAP